MNNSILLEMKNITKKFPGVIALNNVSFRVKKGEIHCLVGENGAGKSTLMKVLSGVHPSGSYEGEILINNELQSFKGISDSEKAGVGIIYQELALVPDMTVYENIFLGHEIKNGAIIDWNETIQEATKMLGVVKLKVNPNSKIKDLGVGKQQLVEIAKALSKKINILILDEPTAALNEDDSENLLKLIKELKTEGVTSVLISHKLKEVIDVADSITVLRDGQSICTLDAEKDEVNENVIIKHMVGRSIDNIYPKRDHKISDEKVLEVSDWSAVDSTGKQILKDINFHHYVFSTIYNIIQKRQYNIKIKISEIVISNITALLVFAIIVYVFCFYRGIPVPVIIFAVIALVINFILSNTKFGRRIYAIGGNEEAARLSGINVFKTTVLIFSIVSILSSLSGVLLASRLNGASPNMGKMFELDAVSAVIIGGTSFSGGVGSVPGTVIGVFIIGVLNNGMSILGVKSFYQLIIKGLIIIIAVWFDVYSRKRH